MIPDAVEALRNLNRQLAAAIADVLLGLTDDQRAFVAPALDARPFGEVVVHAYRPILAAAGVIAGRDMPFTSLCDWGSLFGPAHATGSCGPRMPGATEAHRPDCCATGTHHRPKEPNPRATEAQGGFQVLVRLR